MSNPLAYVSMCQTFANISAAPSTLLFAAPEPARRVRVQLTLNNAITVANDAITVKVDNVSLSGTMVIAFTGSAKGTTFTQDFTGSINTGSLVEVISSGASTTTCIAPCTITLIP
jgi:hypothetical protein